MRAIPPALAEAKLPEPVLHVLRTLRASGHEGWVVGGAVRDWLLGQAPHEYDLATDAHPEQVAACFSRVIETGIAHGTVTVLEDGLPLEVTTYRAGRAYGAQEATAEDTEGEGAPPVDGAGGTAAEEPAYVGTIEEDLAMRDFTVNAMAYDPIGGVFLDPHGGTDDLRERCLRAAGDPDARFREDPLRPMRAARFGARFGFRIERATRRAMARHVEAFRQVAQERIGAELAKILIAPHPRYGLEVLRRSGHLEVFLPELLEGLGMRQNRWHRYDVYHHVLRALQAAAPDLVVRLAVLLHDIDKPRTVAPSDKRPGEFTFYGHEVSGAERAYAICRRLRFSQKIAQEVQLLVREHQFLYTDEWSDAAVRRMLARVGESFDRLLLVREADVRGHGVHTEDGLALLRSLEARGRKLLEERPALQTKDLAIGGREVMEVLGIGPSPRVGRALRHLLELVLEDPSRNERGALLEALQKWEPAPSEEAGS